MSGRTGANNDEPSKVTTQTGNSTPTVNSSLSGFALPSRKLAQKNNDDVSVHERIDQVVPNLRDISISAEMRDMKPGLLYRAARPFSTSFVAVSEVYKDLLRIHTIIDLRDDDLSAIPEEMTARATLSHFYEPFSVTATRPKTPTPKEITVQSGPPSPNATLEAKPPTTIDEPPDSFEDPPPARSRTHKLLAKTANKAQRTISHRPRTLVVDAEGFPLRDSYIAKIQSRRPDLPPAIVEELVTDPQMRPVCDLVANVDPNLPRMLIVNIFDTPEFKKRVMETVTASPYLPMIAMAKVTDKLTGSAYAPFYFCKYIISSHDLYDSYVEMLQCCGLNFGLAMKLVALATRPVLFHCSLGKDRTGLLSMLILSVLGAHPSGIIFDFTLTQMQTNEEFRAYIQKFVVEYSGLPEGFGGASVEAIGRTLDYLRSTYGSVTAYLDSIGFTSPWRVLLRSRYLSSPSAATGGS